MLSLGGQTLGFSGAEQSSATKGETVADTHIVHVEDFLEEPYRQVAGLLYEQLERGQAEPAQIISRFEDVDCSAAGCFPAARRSRSCRCRTMWRG